MIPSPFQNFTKNSCHPLPACPSNWVRFVSCAEEAAIDTRCFNSRTTYSCSTTYVDEEPGSTTVPFLLRRVGMNLITLVQKPFLQLYLTRLNRNHQLMLTKFSRVALYFVCSQSRPRAASPTSTTLFFHPPSSRIPSIVFSTLSSFLAP